MRFPILTVLVALPVFAGPPAKSPVVTDKIADQFTPASFERQRIEGLLGDRMRVNLEGRLLRVDEKALIDCFEHRPGPQEWAGEHAGKFLHAAANTYLYSGDERLKTLMDRMARNLIATQLPDGYLGTYTDDKRWTSWDVWVHKYDLLGLLNYYQATGYEPALEASRKIGDLLARIFGGGAGQRDIIAAGTHMGMAATSVLEAMANLYRFTGDRKYLDFCEYLVRSWDQPNGPRIAASLLATESVFRTANAKAYEMMSNLVGLVELYRITGKAEYLKPAEIAWKDIATHRLYVTGTTSAAEHFQDDFVLPGEEASNVGEGCATVTFLQLTWQLLRATGEARYADQMEHTVYNALLGAQDPRSGDICYFTPLNGKKGPTPGINCCVSSEPRGISMIPQLAWGRRGDGVAVLFYAPGKVAVDTRAGEVAIESTTTYPLDGAVELTVRPAKTARFPLYLRVPSWTARYEAVAGGRSYKGEPGAYLTIDREWAPGDSVKIDMDLTTRVVPGGPSYPYNVAVARGPQFLALESALNRGLLDMQAAGPRTAQVKLTDAHDQLPRNWAGKQAYRMEGVTAGKPRDLVLVPFADARTYRVWLLKP
ncbi:MAG: beta-L-arabinofuranosidase domain-containing protein [Bryobacteraceae bacterium]|jgi:DUF1680 family protein